MTAGLEAAAAEEWLFNTLNGDAQLRGGASPLVQGVHNTEAPEGALFPFILYQFSSGVDLAVVGATRIWTNLVYLVKVVGETADFGDLQAAVARIDALLHRASGVAADGTVWACVREQVIRLPESIAGGRQYRHSGALYRIYAT